MFVEVVATAGAVSASRREALLQIATDANFDEGDVTFVSAFEDRDRSAFPSVRWRTGMGVICVVCVGPDNIMRMHGGDAVSLTPLQS